MSGKRCIRDHVPDAIYGVAGEARELLLVSNNDIGTSCCCWQVDQVVAEISKVLGALVKNHNTELSMLASIRKDASMRLQRYPGLLYPLGASIPYCGWRHSTGLQNTSADHS